MIIESSAYLSLIEYFNENIGRFDSPQEHTNPLTFADYIGEKLADNVMLVCRQHAHLSQEQRFTVVREVDAIINDLENLLEGVWQKSPTQEQQVFLDEFIALLKNLFDNELLQADPI